MNKKKIIICHLYCNDGEPIVLSLAYGNTESEIENTKQTRNELLASLVHPTKDKKNYKINLKIDFHK